MDRDDAENTLDFLHLLEDGHAHSEMYDVLSVAYSRYVLSVLLDRSTVPFDELVEQVAGIEAIETDELVTPSAYERIRIRLYHSVLPKLEDVGYIDFDLADRTITSQTIPAHVQSLLSNEW